MKDRVTLTIERALLRQIDSSVDGTTIKNRSHAVELLLHRAMDGDLPKCAVILGGTTDEHLQAVGTPIHDKPIIRQNVDALIDAGINDIVVIGKSTDKLKELIGEVDADIRYITESSAMGTAGALHLAKPYLTGPFILTNGDEYKELSIKEMYVFHQEHAGLCTIALTTVPDPSEYGVALLNGNRIVTFVEKPSREHAPSNLISAGFYIIEPDVLDLVPNGYAKMEYDIFPKLAQDDRLYGYHFSGEYADESRE